MAPIQILYIFDFGPFMCINAISMFMCSLSNTFSVFKLKERATISLYFKRLIREREIGKDRIFLSFIFIQYFVRS